MIALTEVYKQRIREAVKAARSGADVRFRITMGEVYKLMWYATQRPRVPHVISNAFSEAALAALQMAAVEEFERQLREAAASDAAPAA
jgi:hypothetical protein